MIRILFISTLMILAVFGKRETHRLVTYDGADIVQDIVHDKEENTVTVTVSQTAALENHVPTVNFHDFNTKIVAFKDIKRGACLLTYAPIPFATPDIYKSGRTSLILPYKAVVQRQQMTTEEINSIAGTNIADFCADYKSFWMDLTPKRDYKPVKRTEDEPEPCVFNCGTCTVEVPTQHIFLG